MFCYNRKEEYTCERRPHEECERTVAGGIGRRAQQTLPPCAASAVSLHTCMAGA